MAEEAELVGQLRSLIISMEGWRGQEEREEVEFLSSGHFLLFCQVDRVVEAWRKLLEGVAAPARLVKRAEEERNYFCLNFLSDGLQTVDNLKLFVFKLYSKLLVSNYTIQPFKKVNNYCIQFSRHDNNNMFSCRQGGKAINKKH